MKARLAIRYVHIAAHAFSFRATASGRADLNGSATAAGPRATDAAELADLQRAASCCAGGLPHGSRAYDRAGLLGLPLAGSGGQQAAVLVAMG